MKRLLYTLLLCCTVAWLTASCSGDSEAEALKPTIDESSIVCDVPGKIITFNADRPNGTKIEVLLRQMTNGNEETILDVRVRATATELYVNIMGLTGGTTYAYIIVGYDSNGKEAFRTAERTFTTPKNASPSAPYTYGLEIHSPSSLVANDGYITGVILTLEMEYSTDDGQTWLPVTIEGTISGLPPGKVLLRKAETPTTEAGKSTFVKVPEYKSNTDIDGKDGTSDGLR